MSQPWICAKCDEPILKNQRFTTAIVPGRRSNPDVVSGKVLGHLALLAIFLVLVDQDLPRDDVRVGPTPRDDRRREPLVLENRLLAPRANPRLAHLVHP